MASASCNPLRLMKEQNIFFIYLIAGIRIDSSLYVTTLTKCICRYKLIGFYGIHIAVTCILSEKLDKSIKLSKSLFDD